MNVNKTGNNYISHKGCEVYFKDSQKMDEIPDKSVRLVVTSPPYWNLKEYGLEHELGAGDTYEDYIKKMNNVWEECYRVLETNGKICINIGNVPVPKNKEGFRHYKNVMHDVEKKMYEMGLYLYTEFIWDKMERTNYTMFGSYPYPPNFISNMNFETIFVFCKKGEPRKVTDEIKEASKLTKLEWRDWALNAVWRIRSVDATTRKYHPAIFPEDIPYRLIRMYTFKGDTVLDPFLGSGTAVKIAKILERKGIGYEINTDYKELIWSKLRSNELKLYAPVNTKKQTKLIDIS